MLPVVNPPADVAATVELDVAQDAPAVAGPVNAVPQSRLVVGILDQFPQWAGARAVEPAAGAGGVALPEGESLAAVVESCPMLRGR